MTKTVLPLVDFLLLLLTLLSSITAENSIYLRTYQINNHNRSLQTECTQRSTYLGCYTDRKKKRALPYEVFGRESRDHSPQECEAACAAAGYQVWGRQFRGQCFCGSNEFAMHGVARGCDCCGDDVGSRKFCAYALDTSAPGCIGIGVSSSSSYVGCFEDKKLARALPVEVDGRGWSAEECEAACLADGYEYFAREWKGQCFCGTGGYDVHGHADDCDCCGENVDSNKMCVWHSI
eukprot:CCRYP_007925-RB/>CCRYP_007925-RB protein AED:0.36 eAED:0.36 QI:268/1/1/1/0.5/0.33/3/527/234